MTWEEQQELWRQQYAALGQDAPAQPLRGPYEGSSTLGRDMALTYGLGALPLPGLRPLRAGAGRLLNFFAPRTVGTHHTLYGKGLDAITAPPWNSSRVAPSGLHGRTAGDQIPGMSYYWDATGRGGSRAAANQAQGQTSLMFNNQMLEPGTQGVGKVVTAPRFGPRPDANLPNTRAMMVDQSQPLRVTGEVAARSGPLTNADASLLASMVNRQKVIEGAKSIGKIGAATVAAPKPAVPVTQRPVVQQPQRSSGGGASLLHYL